MNSENIILNESDFELDFLNNETNLSEKSSQLDSRVYMVLISDDDESVHQITKMLLKEFRFEGRKLEFISAYSGEDTKKILASSSNIAVLLQDVIMEEENSGLLVVDYLRNILGNKITRVILRTGQPGKAPEDQIIANYDINDYKSKTELTVQKLYTSMYSCLRSYRDLVTIQRSKKGLERIIKASSTIFKTCSFNEFLTGILQQLATFYDEDSDGVYFKCNKDRQPDGFVAKDNADYYTILAGTGKYEKYIGNNISQIEELNYFENILCELKNGSEMYVKHIYDKGYIAYHKGLSGCGNYIFMEGSKDEIEVELVKVFLSNFSMAIDNFQLHKEMIATQKEIIFTLGELIEKRSSDTANHVRRISEICYIIASASGFAEDKCEEIRIASTMHDIGKIAIPDHILKKAGRLTDEEFEIMKSHSEHGYNILNHSNIGILKTAAIIAKYHHEKYDGTGYPEGIKKDQIPDIAKITAIADVFDALTHKRCYKDAWSIDKTLNLLKENSGKHFDPHFIRIFFDNFKAVENIMKTLT
ncbi:MAG: DUF3369 domain-containing protein [Desulfamplus sp.]|nr:DUF3369 domain-containing protein [Desulfamplus sp.]